MAIGVSEFFLTSVVRMVLGLVQAGTSYGTLEYFKKRKVERRIEDATAETVEALTPFFASEKLTEAQQQLLIHTCCEELQPLVDTPALFFQGSLDGQKIFDQLYQNKPIPEVIQHENMKDAYALLCPRIATLLCKIPTAVKDWEQESWAENFRRLDQISDQLSTLFRSIDQTNSQPRREADELLQQARRLLNQKVLFEMDLTGLRADTPTKCSFASLFVQPSFSKYIDKTREKVSLLTEKEISEYFILNNNHNIIIAPAGAGKSTWSKWLQTLGLSDFWNGIVVRQELRGLDPANLPSIQELVRFHISKHLEEDLTSSKINQWINTRKILILLDGFDEINLPNRDLVFTWIQDLRAISCNYPIIVTSRPLTSEHLNSFDQSWQRWEIDAFDEPRIRDYIQKWYKFTPLLADDQRQINTEELAQSWLADPTINPLTGNPLLLSTLLMVHHLDGCLPSGRSQLYQRYINGMLGIWDSRRNVDTHIRLTTEQKYDLLRSLAIKMFFEEKDQLDEKEVVDWLDDYISKTKLPYSTDEILILLRERTGLINGPGIYNFTHKTITEYFVAEAIYQGNQYNLKGDRIDRFTLFEHRNEDRWNTILFLWAGLAPVTDLEQFIEQCYNSDNYNIAIGLILDQLIKLTAEFSSEIIKHSLNNDLIFKEKTILIHYYISHPDKLSISNCLIEDLAIRNLISHTSYTEALELFISKSIISLLDIKSSLIKHKFLFSSSLLEENLMDFDIEIPVHPQFPLYFFVLFFERLLASNTKSPQNIINIFEQRYPSLGKIKTLLVLSHFNYYPYSKNRSIEKYIQCINLGFTGKEIPNNWLVGTSNWHSRNQKFRNRDLLKDTLKKLQETHQDKEIDCSDAIAIVEQLLNERDKLEVSLN